MAVEKFCLLAIPTPEGTTEIEVQFKIAENEGRRPVAHHWLFALMRFVARRVEIACRCTPPAAYASVTIQQGEVVHQRFPTQRLEDGQSCQVRFDLGSFAAPRTQSLVLSNCN